jgi:steroid delta-isomerase-like uncharacterized protein
VVVAETGETLTYADLDERSLRLARVFYDFGLRPGDHVAVVAENTPQVFEVYWAAIRSGLYVTAVSRHLSAADVAYIVNDCEARALVISSALAPLVDDTPAVGLRLAFGDPLDGFDDYNAALAWASTEPLASQPRGADMQYSSGTTGRPKGVRVPLSDRQVDEGYDGTTSLLGSVYDLGPDTVYLSPAPIDHAAALKFCAAVHALGGTAVMMQRFDAEAALAAIERYGVTHSQWAPIMFVRMLKLDPAVRGSFDLSSHRIAIHGAAPCPMDVKRAMIVWWGPIVHEYYTATEIIGLTVIDSTEWLARPGSVGRARLGTVRICGDDGRVLPTGQIGTVYFERAAPPFAYHNDPVMTAEAYHPLHPSWGTTRDLGYLDQGGYLFLTDRTAFTIISGGVNIYPQEIENYLALHPKVLDVAVIGLPDEELGESVLAVVQPAPGVAATDALAGELTQFLRSRIAHYKVPRRFDFTEDLPRTPAGKMIKGKLKARYPPAPIAPAGREETPTTWIDDCVEAMNRHDWSRVAEFWAEDAVYENLGLNDVHRGREAIVESLKSASTFAPDLRTVLTSWQQTGDHCAAEWEVSGTHTEEAPTTGIPATNKPFSVRGVLVAQLGPDGKVSVCRTYFNQLDFLAQLGLVPGRSMENVKLLRALYAAFSRGDVLTVLAGMDPNIEWRAGENNPYQPNGEPWVGPEAVLKNLFDRLATEWDGFTVNPKEFYGAGDTVVVEARCTGTYKATGKELDLQETHIWRLRAGKVIAFQQYLDTAQLMEVMGAPTANELASR